MVFIRGAWAEWWLWVSGPSALPIPPAKGIFPPSFLFLSGGQWIKPLPLGAVTSYSHHTVRWSRWLSFPCTWKPALLWGSWLLVSRCGRPGNWVLNSDALTVTPRRLVTASLLCRSGCQPCRKWFHRICALFPPRRRKTERKPNGYCWLGGPGPDLALWMLTCPAARLNASAHPHRCAVGSNWLVGVSFASVNYERRYLRGSCFGKSI